MADETIKIEISAVGTAEFNTKIKAASARVQQLDNVTKDYWKTERGLAIQRRAANTHIGALTKSSNQLDNTMEGLRKTAQSLGGKLGEMSEKAVNAKDAIALLGGPASVGVAAAVTVAAIGAAGLATAANLSTLIDTLDELGGKDYVTREQRQQAEEIDDVLKQVQVAATRAAISFGSEFAPALITVANGIVIVSEAYNRLDEATSGGWLETLSDWSFKFVTIPWQTAKLGIDSVAGAWEELDRQIADGEQLVKNAKAAAEDWELNVYGNFETVEDQLKKQEDRKKEAEASNKKAEEEAKRRAAEAKRRAEQQAAAEKKAAEERARQLLEEDKLRRYYIDQRVQASRAVREQEADIEAEQLDALRAMRMAEAQAAQAKQQEDERAAEAKKQGIAADYAAIATVTNATAQASQAIVDMIDTRTQAGKKAARIAFGINKALQLGNAVANVASGITQAFTLPPPFSWAQAAAVGIAGGVQIAKIAATRPQFHRGTAGSPQADEMLLRNGERAAIMTAQAQDDGAAEAVNRGNAGLSASNTGPVVLQVGSRYFDAQVNQASTRAGSGLRRAERRNRRAVGHSRRSRS